MVLGLVKALCAFFCQKRKSTDALARNRAGYDENEALASTN
jgi:hypothetical protein